MRFVKKIIKWLLFLVAIPLGYLLVAVILSMLTVPKKNPTNLGITSVFLHTNGVHLDIIVAKKDLDNDLRTALPLATTDAYVAFGWGDADFYRHTPTWNDVTLKIALRALFLESSTAMHVTRHEQLQQGWVEVSVDAVELSKLNTYLYNSFQHTAKKKFIPLAAKGYGDNDMFYKAVGNYSCLHTCNTWVNTGFIESGLKASYWTPFDFGLLQKYK